MSRRRSTGDLVPRDITEILAREARVQRGQKKPGSSLGQAFSWLKGSRRKKSVVNGLNRAGGGVTDAKLGHQNLEPAKAGPKGNEDQKRLAVHYRTSQHYQENVFIEGSRPQYLEDLHTEAQEGLKILQQEEHKNGVNFPDDESVASTDTLRPEQDISSKDGGGSPESTSTAGSTDTTLTSTRPVLTRQGSTFKPLNPVKRLDKSRRRSRRTTIMGIPNQVQKELALHRSSTFQPLVSTQPSDPDGELRNSHSGVVVIPTVDGGTPVANKEGARVHLSELEASREEQLLRTHIREMYQDEQPFNHQGPLHCPSTLRPKSLAVPGMTTSSSFSPSTLFSFLQEPQGPVMSISPQATYLSTIIPNAVLPASIEVIEIDRSTSRPRGSSVNHGSSVRTVSKSSLASMDSSVSPMVSRRSDDDGSQTDTSLNDPTLMPMSPSGSNWSESQSSKTIMSNSSPVPSKSSTRSANSQRVRVNGQESQSEQCSADQDHVSVRSSALSMVSTCKSETAVTGRGSESGVSASVAAGEDAKSKQNFSRSLSVMKTKQPPAPPRRTNSLHNNKIRSSTTVLVESKELNDSVAQEQANATPNVVAKDEIKAVTEDTSKMLTSTESSSVHVSSSPLSPTQTGGTPEPRLESSNFSPQKTPPEGGKFERTMSPSSGYSSQSGTPTLSPKGMSPTSPDKLKKKPVKPERSVSRASSSAASPSSSLTSLSSGTSDPANPDVPACSPSPLSQDSPASVAAKALTHSSNNSLSAEVRDLLNIPPPPKVKAPCPPPPETWVHNKRSFELLCGPSPNVKKVTQKPAQMDGTVKQAGTHTEASKEMQVLVVEKQSTADKLTASQLSESQARPEPMLPAGPEVVPKEVGNREHPGNEQEKMEESADVQKEEQSGSSEATDPQSQEATPKKDPPPVMKKPTTVLHREEVVSTIRSVDTSHEKMNNSDTAEVNLPTEDLTTFSQSGIVVIVDKSESEMDKSEVASMQTLSTELPKISKASPPPTPPPAYHPTPPLSRKTPPSSVSAPPDELQGVQEEIHVVESCWPPPPPPMDGDSVFDGGDEVDFPPPPPPFVTDSLPNVIDGCITGLDVSKGPTEEAGETEEDSGEAGTSGYEQVTDLPPAVTQSVQVVGQDSKADSSGEISCRPEQTFPVVSDSVPPPPAEAPLLTPITRTEHPVSGSLLCPSSSFLRRDSLKSEDHPSSDSLLSAQTPITVPDAPPLPAENLPHGVNFRRQPSLANRDARSKELLSRHKSAPIPKEDANIPLVTPSLLQMVRLRSVNMTEDQTKAPSDDKSTYQGAQVQENSPVSPQNIPQKPIRKSLSIKSPPQTVRASSATLNSPSMRLQEAIRMKTAAMSSRDGLPSRLGVRSSTYSCVTDLKSPEGCDMHKSPASTASFIFSRSTKKVIIETAAASSPEAQASLKQSLTAELMHVSDQSKAAAFSNGGVKSDKIPPPVAKKPAHGSMSPSQSLPACLAKMDFTVDGNGAIGVHHTSGITPPETTTTRVTADTIETLF